MPVEGLPANAKLVAEVGHLRFLLPHGGHGQAHLCRCHLERCTTFSPAGPGRRQSGFGSLGNQASFEFRERSEDAEHELARRGGGVDGCAVAREHLKADAALAEIVNDVDEMVQVASQPVEFPDDQGVPRDVVLSR